MQKVAVQRQAPRSQPAVRQGKEGMAIESPQGEKVAQLETLAGSDLRARNHARLATAIEASPLMAAQRRMEDAIDNSPRQAAQRKVAGSIRSTPQISVRRKSPEDAFGGETTHGDAEEPSQTEVVQRAEVRARPNNTGLPDKLKSGVESLSGMSMDNVRVHYGSPRPARLNALAYAQGTEIHVAPGQERHLPHEAWHVVQQEQGRVRPTMQMNEGVPVNDDQSLEHEADVMGERATAIGVEQGASIESDPIDFRNGYRSGDEWQPPSLRGQHAAPLSQRRTESTAPVQRYINPLIFDDLYGPSLAGLKVTLSAKIGAYNAEEDKLLREHADYYSTYDIPKPWIERQRVRLDELQTIIDRGIGGGMSAQWALERLAENIAANQKYLQEGLTIIELGQKYNFNPGGIFKVREQTGGSALLSEAVHGAEKSGHLGHLMSTVAASSLATTAEDKRASPETLAKLLHLSATNQFVRPYLAKLSPDNDIFKDENLEALLTEIERLQDWFGFLIETRKLPESVFDSVKLKLIARLVSGEIDYQSAASELAMGLPRPITLLEIADEFTTAMHALGYRVFLSGGGAITFRGGTRPIADLDFRIDAMPGLTSFRSSHGKELLKMANRVLEIASTKKEKGIGYSNFTGMGAKAMTIATQNWYGVEVSLSINQAFSHEPPEKVEFQTHSREYLERVEPSARPTRGVALLTLTDLLRDKLKAAITRTKEGETSYKKVAQDLFDVVSVVQLMRERGQDVLDRATLMTHLEARAFQYQIQNLDPIDMTRVKVESVVKLMLYRLVRTAQIHLQKGERQEQFWSLAARSPKDLQPVLERLAEIDIHDLLEASDAAVIEEWLKKWVLSGTALEDRRKIPGKNPGVEALEISPRSIPEIFRGDALVAEILASAPANLDLSDMKTRILYIVYKSEGHLRFLGNSGDAIKVMAAFSSSVSVRAFSEFYVTAKKENLVEGKPQGLRLLGEGVDWIEAKIKAAAG